MAEKRKTSRREFGYYMQVTDDETKKLVGYLSDISPNGFRLDTLQEIAPGQDFRLHIELTPEVADKNFMVFIARSKWCRRDHVDPTTFNVGFEIVNIAPSDAVIFQRMYERYGLESPSRKKRSDDYLWR
ncbi:MAG TPA: PilZ domain-containing protein [Anaerolineales bacterium]|nr:PilZ domain-containing protein [Anaerolineales bacterium]